MTSDTKTQDGVQALKTVCTVQPEVICKLLQLEELALKFKKITQRRHHVQTALASKP